VLANGDGRFRLASAVADRIRPLGYVIDLGDAVSLVDATVIYWRGPSPYFYAPLPPKDVAQIRRASTDGRLGVPLHTPPVSISRGTPDCAVTMAPAATVT